MKAISLTGPSGTGKTTMFHKIIYKLKMDGLSTYNISEVARRCPYPLNCGNLSTQMWIWSNQYIEEQIAFETAEKSPKLDTIILSERTNLDTIGYMSFYGLYTDDLLKRSIESADRFDLILFFDPPKKKDYTITDDGIRNTSKEEQVAIGKKIDSMYDENGVTHFHVKSFEDVSDEERDNYVFTLIDSVLYGPKIACKEMKI
jgi:nicotinamide riboside kinase